MKIFNNLKHIIILLSVLFVLDLSYSADKGCETEFSSQTNNQGLSKRAERLLQEVLSIQEDPLKVKPGKYIKMIKTLVRRIEDESITSFAIRASFNVLMLHHKFTGNQVLQLINLVSEDDQKHIIHQILNQIDNPEDVSIVKDKRTLASLVKDLERRFPYIVGERYNEMAEGYEEQGENYLYNSKEAERLLEEAEKYNHEYERYSRMAEEYGPEYLRKPREERRTGVKPSDLYQEAANMAARAEMTSREAQKAADDISKQLRMAHEMFGKAEEMRKKAHQLLSDANLWRK